MSVIILELLFETYIMQSFLEIDPNSQFHLTNIPFGVFRSKDNQSLRCATRIGDFVIDLAYLEAHAGFKMSETEKVFDKQNLNAFIALGKAKWSEARQSLQVMFSKGSKFSCDFASQMNQVVYKLDDVEMALPMQIGDYTDFYSSRNHAYNVGVMFRGPENALQPNWLWLPVGYHGRSSSIVVSPASFPRPSGQLKAPTDTVPRFGKSKKMDFELEVGMVVGKSNKLGEPIKIEDAQ